MCPKAARNNVGINELEDYRFLVRLRLILKIISGVECVGEGGSETCRLDSEDRPYQAVVAERYEPSEQPAKPVSCTPQPKDTRRAM